MKIENLRLHNRLDVFIKILYIKAFIEGYDFIKYRDLYRKHIVLYNGGIEDHKTTVYDFENDFQKLVHIFQEGGFNDSFPIQINKNGELLNGAHRLACCLYFKISPKFEKKDGGKKLCWSMNWFQSNNFSQEEQINILDCYTDYRRDFFIYIVWPPLLIKYQNIQQDLGKIGKYIGGFDFNTNKKILSELIHDIYSYDDCNLGGGLGINKKIILLNASKNKKIRILIFEKNKDIKINERKVKDTIREKYKVFTDVNDGAEKFYTFHSGEDQEENNYIKKIVLNHNNLKFYKHRQSIESNNEIISNIKNFRKYCKRNKLDINDFCIVGSSILEIFHLRKAKDLDFISTDISSQKIKSIGKNVEIFEYNYSRRYSNIDLIKNTRYHLFFRGHKLVSPEYFLEIKLDFNRKKDIPDIKLLQDFLLSNQKNNSLHYIYKNILFEFLYLKKRFSTHLIIFVIRITKKIGIYKQVSYFWRKYILKI